MDKKVFWQLIGTAKEKAGDDLDLQYKLLVGYLAELSVEEIMTWQEIFNEYQRLSYKEKLWAAAYVINGGCSDDGFDYFRAWLTAQGREVFFAALEDPDSLAGYEDAKEDEAFFEDIMSAGCFAYFKKLAMKERDYALFYSELDKHPLSEAVKADLAADIVYHPEIDIQWDEADLAAAVPKLCEKFDWN